MPGTLLEELLAIAEKSITEHSATIIEEVEAEARKNAVGNVRSARVYSRHFYIMGVEGLVKAHFEKEGFSVEFGADPVNPAEAATAGEFDCGTNKYVQIRW